MKSKMSKFSICVVLFLCLNVAHSYSNFFEILKRQISKEEFEMLVTEEGRKYKEKVTFDMTNRRVVHDVPAHRNISKSTVIVDFASKLTVTKFPSEHVCYIGPIPPDEPSLASRKESMNTVSNGTYKMKTGFRLITTQWRIKQLADMSKLSAVVIDFCRGMHIYEVEEQGKDGAKVIKAVISKEKRSTSSSDGALYVSCYPWSQIQNELTRCDRSQYILKCRFPTRNCFHYVTCTNGQISFTDGDCTSTHKFNDFTCCTPACP